MNKQTFFHTQFDEAGAKMDARTRKHLQFRGFSLLITAISAYQLKVTHTYCGRNDSFSKKKARKALRDYQQQGKHTVDCYTADLPRYMSQLADACFKSGKSYAKYHQYAWRFVPKAEQ